MRLLRLFLLLTSVVILTTGHGLAAARIAKFIVTGAAATQPTGINLSGTIVGYYLDSEFSAHGFLRNISGSITTFDVPGASEGDHLGTFANAINDAGEVAGTYSGSDLSWHGFLRDTSGNITTFDVPGETMSGNTYGPQGINDAGQVVGISRGATTGDVFTMQADGTFSIFTPGGGNAAYVGINSLGEVAGTYSDTTERAYHGFFIDTSDNITTFDVPGAIGTQPGYGTWAYSLNDSGVIAGFWVDTNFTGHGYLRKPSGVIVSYNVPGTTTFGGGTYINSAGTVVSTSFTDTHSNPIWAPFIRNHAGNITSVEVPDTDEAIATGINQSGEICGFFAGQKGVTYAFLRTP
jgi:hypothetical protein